MNDNEKELLHKLFEQSPISKEMTWQEWAAPLARFEEQQELRKASFPMVAREVHDGEYVVYAKSLELPTEDEVYEEAQIRRTNNVSSKAQRLATEVEVLISELQSKSDELMRTKMELSVLMDETGLSDLPLGILSEIAEGNVKDHIECTVIESRWIVGIALNYLSVMGQLQYAGTDLLKTYAQLKAVFDIDNERPDPALYSKEKLERLVDLMAPEPGLKKWEKEEFKDSIRASLKEKVLKPETVSNIYMKNVSSVAKEQTLNEYTKYYNSNFQL